MPGEIPVTVPVAAPIVATAGTVLVHIPPGVGLVSVVVYPWHTDRLPDMEESKLMVTVMLAVQPAGVV